MSVTVLNIGANPVRMTDGAFLAPGVQRTLDALGALETSAVNRGQLRVLLGGVEIGPSPASVEADVNGVLTIASGNVSLVEISVDGGASWHTFASSTGQQVPVRKGDQARITYTVAPTVTRTSRES